MHQFSDEDAATGGAADGVVREEGELKVEEGARPEAADVGGHGFILVAV